MDEDTVRRIVGEELLALSAEEGARRRRNAEAAAERRAETEVRAAERAAIEIDTYSAAEAAGLVGMSAKSLQAAARKGDPSVPAVRFGREWRFPKATFMGGVGQ